MITIMALDLKTPQIAAPARVTSYSRRSSSASSETREAERQTRRKQ
jgi:hypothetical protein